LTSKPSPKKNGAILGAAFLMATSAIGPGFLTQTASFTETLLAGFGFVILTSIVLDIGAQLNIWRILSVSNLRAQELSNRLLPGLGYFLSVLIVLGGLAFNIGNIAGCGLGLQVLTGMKVEYAAIISCLISLLIFWIKDAGKALDWFVKILGLLMIVLTVYVAWTAHPPIGEAIIQSFSPDRIDSKAIITLVGGTVGGYISFAGAHRLLDAGISGKENIAQVNRSAVSGIVITGVMRTILFLAALGVVSQGVVLDKVNPASTVFLSAAGKTGLLFFGIVMWSAAITSVVGASFTSVSFIRTFHPAIDKHYRLIISVFIIISTIIFVGIGKPKELLLAAGLINGFILPIALAVILIAARKTNLMGTYRHPLWMQISGWMIVGLMTWMAIAALR